MNEENKIYYRRLDVIRNISCIMVLLYHLGLLKGGFLAVCTFFSLSGYLTCMSALKRKDFGVKSYYLSRIKKLYLPLVIVVFITVILAKIIPNITWLSLRKETISALLGYNNFYQLSANLDYFTRSANTPFTHLWYIAILMQFEFVFPIIFVALRKIENKYKKDISIIIMIILSIVTTVLFYYMSATQNIMIVYYNTFARAFSICVGVLAALIHYKYNYKISNHFQKHSAIIFIMYIMVFISLSIFADAQSKYFAIFMILTTIITIRMIKYSTLKTESERKANIFTKNLARISYEIYLVQYPVIYFMQRVPMNEVLKTILIIVLTVIISLVLYFVLNFKFRSKISKSINIVFLILIIIAGSFIIFNQKDYNKEMNELEQHLNENAKIMEEKNKEYLNSKNKEKTVNQEKEETSINIEETENIEKKVKNIVKNLPVVGVGDSVMLDVVDDLYKKFPKGYFDAKISRSIIGGQDVLKDLKSKGKLGNVVILGLATNGDYVEKRNKDLMKLLGDREVYWVNAVGADDPKFNEKFKKFAEGYSNIHIVDWNEAAKDHPEYFYPDGIHVKEKGIKAYANVVYQTIYNDYLGKYKKMSEETV